MAEYEENKFVLEYLLRHEELDGQELSSLVELIGKHWRTSLDPIPGVLQSKRVRTEIYQSVDGEVLVSFRSYANGDVVKLSIDIASPR